MDQKFKEYIDRSVLCWLATASADGQPNVSPKEVFAAYGDRYIIVANIASPNTVNNIRQNQQVCISFVDIFVQKGFQIKGQAEIIEQDAKDFAGMEAVLLKFTEGKYPFRSITRIEIGQVKPIIAPKYVIYPETTEQDQIESAMGTYRVRPV